MSGQKKKEVGTITWIDLTVENAEEIKNFYSRVVGWKSEPFDMGGYHDFTMNPPHSGNPAAGICHAKGTNTGLPPQWLIYITVDNVDKSAKQCVELGGKLIVEPKNMGEHSRFCVIEDPAGAVTALFEPTKKE